MVKAVIKVQNCFSWLSTDDPSVLTTLWKSLRVREKNYFHSRLYKNKVWDGYTDFFKKESGRFLTGLLPEVTLALKYLNVDYKINKEYTPLEFKYQNIDQNFMNQWLKKGKKPVELFDYQVDFINQAMKYHRCIIQAPTSAGKSLMMIGILKGIPDNAIALVLANKKSLVQQNYKAMMDWGFPNVGRVYDNYEEPNTITCATIQSMHKLEKLIDKVQILIVDEIHDLMSKAPRVLYNKLKNCSVRIGVSATPFKFDGKDLSHKYAVKGYFGAVLKSKTVGGVLTTKTLQDREIISKSHCTFYPITYPEIPYDIYRDAVTNGISNNIDFHNIVVRLTKKLKGRTLILVERIEHGDMLSSLIPGSLWVRGEDNIETREDVITKLQESKDDLIAIATQGIFNAGINVFVHNLINAAGGQAEHQIIQRMGRGLRTAKDKDILNYYDFIFKINDYLLTHSNKRIKILKKEGHEVVIKEEIDF